jgi:hypothetical protein
MNKLLFYTLAAGASLLGFSSCKKNNLVIGKNITPPAFVKIGTWNAADTVGTYAVKATNAPFKIPIGITNVSDKDRTIQFTYTSATAVAGQQFNAPASIVIKAGEALDSLEITGIYDGYPSITKVDQVKITISGGDVPVNGKKFNYILTMKRYWEADLNAFSGVYTIQDYSGDDPDGGPYQVTITPVSLDGPTSHIAITGLWGYDDPVVNVTLDWTDLTSGTTTVPKAPWFFYDDNYGTVTINPNTASTWAFTTTPNQLTIGYEGTLVNGTLTFGKYHSVLTQ